MLGVAVMIRDKYAVRLAPEQLEELQNQIRVGKKLLQSDRQGPDSPQEQRWLGRSQGCRGLGCGIGHRVPD